MSLKSLFKKKPGGTTVGNLLRGVSSIAATAGVPFASNLSKLLGEAPPLVQQTAQSLVGQVSWLPQQTPIVAQQLASQAALEVEKKGGTAEEAEAVRREVNIQAQLPAVETPVLTSNSLTAQDLKNIGGKVLEGAKSGAVEGFMDTDEGKAAKAEAVDQQMTSMLPKILIGLVCYIAYTKVVKKS